MQKIILLQYHLKIVFVSREKLKTVLTATLKNRKVKESKVIEHIFSANC